jgi:hypothetical protein
MEKYGDQAQHIKVIDRGDRPAMKAAMQLSKADNVLLESDNALVESGNLVFECGNAVRVFMDL